MEITAFAMLAAFTITAFTILDFCKAFDSVPHNELLLKLHNLGVSGDLWLWLQCYLEGRSQCVCIDGSRYSFLPVISGVPQGSILGPLLFLVYVNDLPDCVLKSSLYMFADDAKCAYPIRCTTDSTMLQDDLDLMCKWSSMWKLSFKESKCVHLRCRCKDGGFDSAYSLNGVNLATHNTYKDLGIIISSGLSFNEQ